MAGAVGLRKRTCGICYISEDFRVLQCGHPLCLGCLKDLFAINSEKIIPCPFDQKEDRRKPQALPKPEKFIGNIYYTYVEENAEPQVEARGLRGRKCGLCFESGDFRVLQCGHLLCINCLNLMHAKYKKKIRCPWDNSEYDTQPHVLPRPYQFDGKIFYNISEDIPNFRRLLAKLAEHRKSTIQHLRNVANIIQSDKFNCAISKIAGSVVGFIGSVVGIVGFALSLTGFLAFVGIPMAIAGASVGTAGGITTAGTAITEALLRKYRINEIQKDINMDRFLSEKIAFLLERAKGNPELLELWDIDPELVANLGRPLPSFVKVGITTAAGVRVAFGIGRAAATTGLHIAGIVFAAAAIPLDLGQIISSSITIHKKEQSIVVRKLKDKADMLEHGLRKGLVKEECFRLVYTNDGHWAYINIHTEKKFLFEEKLKQGLYLNEIKEFGEIVESGEDEIPEETRQKMHDEWYSHAEDYVRLVHTTDGKWAYIEIHVKKRVLFQKRVPQSFTLNMLREFGDIIKSGEGIVPMEIRQRMNFESKSRLSGCYTHLFHTIDGYWVYIRIPDRMEKRLQEVLPQGFALNDLEEFGTIIESGEGKVPEEAKQRVYDEWFPQCKDLYQLVYTINGKWAFIKLHATKKLSFREMLPRGFSLNELEEFGEVFASGEGEVHEEIKQKMYDEWHPNCKDLYQLIYTNDGHWAYIKIHTKMKLRFREMLPQGFTLKELDEFGDIMESGEDEVSEEIEQRLESGLYQQNDGGGDESLEEDSGIKR